MVDTAELYPVPLTAPDWKAGATEEYIGSWLEKNPEWRSRIVLATKVCGYMPSSAVAAARTIPPTSPSPDCRLDRQSIRAAFEASCRRLRTDYIDLYQLHWPDRYVPLFGDTMVRCRDFDSCWMPSPRDDPRASPRTALSCPSVSIRSGARLGPNRRDCGSSQGASR